ncbi:putative molybdenum cofactor synthesis protein 2 large subunit [Phlyctochytrium arcticum]|nr:putative molybdenum cofactor synthesis protein 2 large subunit [Phlyctochytrium arcticum]
MASATAAPSSSDGGGVDYVHLTHDPLCAEPLISRVRDTGAGAIASFSGTTRDNFTTVTRTVLHLSYEAYEPMAVAQLRVVLADARAKYPSLVRTAVAHRLGLVPVGEESVIITASSPHRKDAMHAVEYIIDHLKTRVPIWKREAYTDGSVWKENNECSWSLAAKKEVGAS